MFNSVEGVFRNGQVELLERPPALEETRVIVTFLPVERRAGEPPNFTPQELADLRGKLQAWEEDWNAPGMEAYGEL
ncbi:MAG: hypothetical protein KY476_01830 [Planctomycetes bacterium]|nr:hypothetical protein [Planctomycetota bacterium]